MRILKKEDLTQIGIVNKTIGFNGKLTCLVSIAHPEKLLKQKFLFILLDGLPVPYAIENIDANGDELLVKFEDVDSELEAKKLLRKEIYAAKIKTKKKEDVVSWKDLRGYKAIDNFHGEIGIIEDVQEFPMQMIGKCLVKEKEILFPLNDDTIVSIDHEEKKIFLDLPEGLLDLYLK